MEKGKLIKEDNEYYLNDDLGVIIASTDKILLKETDTVKKLSLKNCEAIDNGYDLDELYEKVVNSDFSDKYEDSVHYYSFIEGFQKALEILSNKKFTENQVRMAIEIAWRNDIENTKIDIIESIIKSEWDVDIEMDFAIYPANLPKEGEERPVMKPKLDTDGCLILKRKMGGVYLSFNKK